MVVAQLVEGSLSTPEVNGLYPIIGKIFIESFLSTVLKRRNKEKEPGNGPFFNGNMNYEMPNSKNYCITLVSTAFEFFLEFSIFWLTIVHRKFILNFLPSVQDGLQQET